MRRFSSSFCFRLFCAAIALSAIPRIPAGAAALPGTLAPPAPFPPIAAQSFETEFVAPGVRRGRYLLATSSGPLSIEVVAVDLREPTVRVDDVLANDKLLSPGETVSAMALRTHAIAGINADYFDIGQTNQPLNIVVKNGLLIRTPSRRVVIDLGRDKSVHFENLRFIGSVQNGPVQIPLTAVNEFPPQGGASFLTSAFGTIAVQPVGITMVNLAPLGPLTSVAGSYRVTAVGAATAGPILGPTLALGPAALGFGPAPAVDAVLQIAADTDPPLAEIVTALGGGPLLLSAGKPFDDPNAPAPEERNRRFPLAGAAVTADGTLLLIAVDGRQPALSVGLTRPEFGALMSGLGATDGIAFDSGGSATLVGRVLGEPQPRVLNAPSDGIERPVADGLFVYSDAPAGPPARLVVRPDRIVALPGATFSIGATRTDAAGHYLGGAAVQLDPSPLARFGPGGALQIANRPGSGVLIAHDGALRTEIPVTIVDKVAKLTILPDQPNPNAGDLVQLNALGSDPSGRAIVTAGAVEWSADRGTFSGSGLYHAATADATVTAKVAGITAKMVVHVGRHDERQTWFGAAAAGRWRFSTFPAQGPGTTALEPEALRLDYDFTGTERAAYANANFPIAGNPVAVSVEIEGDGSGVGIRGAFVNRFGERNAVTIAKSVDWRGWQRRTVQLPGDMNPPITLVSLYAVSSLGTPAVRSAGTLRFRNPVAVVPGTAPR